MKDTIGLLVYSVSCTLAVFNLGFAEDFGPISYIYVSLILFLVGVGTLFGMTMYYHYDNQKRESFKSTRVPSYNNKKYDESESKGYKTY